jgi:hypothetical protein
VASVLAALALCGPLTLAVQEPDEEYLGWSAERAESIGKAAYQKGRVGGWFDSRLLKTERSYNYKLAATWLTPEVIRATARLLQLQRRLTPVETTALVRAGEEAGDTVVLVEIDPREGSGVIPLEWDAILQPRRDREEVTPARGVSRPELRDVKALAGVMRRNYDYDRFWMVFPLQTGAGEPLFGEADTEAELVIRIYNHEGRVRFPIPSSIRARLARPSAGR